MPVLKRDNNSTRTGQSANLSLALRRTQFNCCTQIDHEVTIDPDGTYVLELHEQYLPGQTAICGCSCIFDFDITVADVAPGQIPLRVQYSWLDETPYRVVEQPVDLGPDPVEIIVSDSETMWPPCDYDDI